MSASLEIVKLNEELVRKNIQISDQGKRMSEIKAENGMLHLQITELEKELNVTPELQEVLDFLLGIGDLNGYDFSEKPEGQGSFWWRSHLRKALRGEG